MARSLLPSRTTGHSQAGTAGHTSSVTRENQRMREVGGGGEGIILNFGPSGQQLRFEINSRKFNRAAEMRP